MGVDMDDNYIDNLFREKFENPQQFDFDESAWLDLESRIDNGRKTRVIPWRWLASASILLPILMVSFYFYYELRQTEEQLAKLELKMNHLLTKKQTNTDKKISSESKIPYNKTVEHSIATRQSATRPKSVELAESTPTIRSANLNKNSTNPVETSSPFPNINSNRKLIDSEVDIDKNEKVATSPTAILAQAVAKEKDIHFIEGKQKIVAKNSNRQDFPIIQRLDFGNNAQVLDNKAQLREAIMTYFLPISFEIGVNTFSGTRIPATKSLATIQKSKPFFNGQGIEVGANFINGVDLTVGANITNYSYETTTIEQDFPSIEPNSVGDIFNNVTVTESVLQIPVGLKYIFGDYDDVVTPFVEVGGIAKRNVETSHRFEYLPLVRGNEPYAISPKPQRKKENLTMNTASVSGGLKWNPKTNNQLLNNLLIQAEVFVNADFEATETAWTAGVGLSANYIF